MWFTDTLPCYFNFWKDTYVEQAWNGLENTEKAMEENLYISSPINHLHPSRPFHRSKEKKGLHLSLQWSVSQIKQGQARVVFCKSRFSIHSSHHWQLNALFPDPCILFTNHLYNICVLNTLPSPPLLTKCVYTNSRKLSISLSKQTKTRHWLS